MCVCVFRILPALLQQALNSPQFAQSRLSRSKGGHPQLGVFVPIWPVSSHTNAMIGPIGTKKRVPFSVFVCISSMFFLPFLPFVQIFSVLFRFRNPVVTVSSSFPICACHPSAGGMLILSVSFQFYRMIPEESFIPRDSWAQSPLRIMETTSQIILFKLVILPVST